MQYKKAIYDFLNNLWNLKYKRNSGIYNIFHKNVIIESPIKTSIGQESLRKVNQNLLYSFPNISINDIEIWVQHHKIITTWLCNAKHENPFNGIKETGKILQYKGVTTFEFQENHISKYNCIIDMNNLYSQLNHFPKADKYQNQHTICNKYDVLIKHIGQYFSTLTTREIECLCFWVNGRSAKDIALFLKISHRTVEQHISNIMDKLSISNKHHIIEQSYIDNMIYALRDLYDLIINHYKS